MQGSTKHVAGRVLLIVDPAVNEFESERAIRAVGGRVVEGDPRIGLRVVELAPGASEEAAVRSLRGQSGILAAELDELVPLSDITPNDPHYPKQTHLGAIKAPKAWVSTTGSPSVIVAVIDTGVNGDHPDLAGRLLPGWNTYDNNAIFADVYGHGTKVAGTMTAASNNGVGIASICWNCMILPIRASQPSGSASYSALAAGVMWAADHGARVANMSYQVSASSSVTYAAQYFMSKGGLVFASAGNYSTNDPAPDNPSIVTVSGVDPVSGNLYAWSNYGNNIDVTAPGCTGYTTLMNLGYGSGCGTSYSSPIAAAVAALIFSANPSLTPAQALGILKSSATDLGPAGWDIRFGAGMVDAEKAVAMANGQSTADTNGPAVSVVSPTSGTKLKGAFAASASVTDAAGSVESVTFKIGSTQVCHFVAAPYSCSIDSTAYPDGASQFIVVAVDDSGNTTTTPIAIIIENADITKPAVSITSPAAGSTVSGTISIAFAASDAVGVTGITVTAGSTAVCSVAGNATSCSWDTTKIANGLVPVTVTARDAAGNTQAATTSVTVANVDSIPPTVTILSPAGGASVSGSIAISFSAADDVGVVSTVVSAGATTLCSVAGPASSCSWNTLAVSNGPVTINVTARDAAGNSKSAATNVTVANADNVKPTVAITAPAAGATVSGTVGIAFSAADNVGVTAITVTAGSSTVCSLAGTATACSWNTTLVSNGAYAITVTARDNAGNVQSAIANVNVTNLDVQKPTVNILAPAAGATVTGTTVITFTTTDNVGVTGITVIAGSSTLCTLAGTATSCSWNTVQLANGAYTITVTARDAAGNSLAVARSVTVSNADKTAPAVTITAPAASASVTGTVPVTFSATDSVGVSSITVSAGGTTICTLPGNATSCAWDTKKALNGAQTISVTAKDAAGNSQSAGRAVTVNNPTPDTVKPTVAFTTPLHGSTVKGTVTVGLTSSDNVKVTKLVLTVNGAAICTLTTPTGSCAWNTLLSPNGGLTLTATAYDAAGNTGVAQVVVTVVNGDVIPPVVAFVLPTATTLQGAVDIQVSASDNLGVANVMVTLNGKPICHLGGTVASCSWNTAVFPNGTYTLLATARDLAGNAGTATKTVTISNVAASGTTDTIKPMGVITSPGFGSSLKGLVSAAYAAYDDKAVSRVIIRLNTLTLCSLTTASGTCSIDTSKYADGLYNLVVVVYDPSRNGTLSYIQVKIANTAIASEAPQLLEEPTLDEMETDLELNPDPQPEPEPGTEPENPTEPPQE